MSKNIILFPHKLGQQRAGVNKTPHMIRPFLKNEKVSQVQPKGCLYKNLNNLYNLNSDIKFPKVNIGGDHSMSIATVASSLNKYDNLKVLWIDAHPDLNTYKASLTKNYHGMPLSFLTGLDKDKINFPFIKKHLKFENLLYIGVREIDDFEREVMNRYNIKHIKVDEIEKDIYKCIKDINNFVKDDPIHLSFDVDSMDMSVIYSTGTPVKNGIKYNDGKKILDFLSYKRIVNADVTELNLEIGDLNQKMYSLANTLKLVDKVI